MNKRLLVFVSMFVSATVLCHVESDKQGKTVADELSYRVSQEKGVEAARWFILTGGPSTGKTSLLEELKKRGHAVKAEAATDYIRQRIEAGVKEPWLEPDFQLNISLLHASREEEALNEKKEVVFFDRGPVDSLSYCLLLKKPCEKGIVDLVEKGLSCGAYHPMIFVTQELGIFQNTEVRHEDQDEARRLAERFVKDYASLGFEIVFVPSMSIAERADFIEKRIVGSVNALDSGN